MTPSHPKDVFNGVVQRAIVNQGSKSEHNAIVLKTDQGDQLKLRVGGLNPFESRGLSHLVGSRVKTEGIVANGALFVGKLEDIVVLGPPGRPARPPQP